MICLLFKRGEQNLNVPKCSNDNSGIDDELWMKRCFAKRRHVMGKRLIADRATHTRLGDWVAKYGVKGNSLCDRKQSVVQIILLKFEPCSNATKLGHLECERNMHAIYLNSTNWCSLNLHHETRKKSKGNSNSFIRPKLGKFTRLSPVNEHMCDNNTAGDLIYNYFILLNKEI